MYSSEMTNASTPTSWVYNMYNRAKNETHSKFVSRVEIASLQDGTPVFLPNETTYMMNIETIFVCNQNQQNSPDTVIIANQSKVPSKQ